MRFKLLATVLAALSALVVLAGPAAAQETATVDDVALVQFNLDVIYFMVAAGLVFWMQAGFSMLEAGMTRSKNSANIMMKNMADACFGILMYFLVGFGFMYGASAGGFIGTDTFALSAGAYSEAGLYGGDAFLAADFLFQAVFAATAATIVSGAVAGRMKFSGYIIITLLMTTLIYPIVGHWKWGGGWLDGLGFYDFAGSTLVHMTGGVAALVIAAILGPRMGKFGKDGKPRPIPGHSMPLATLGMFALFWGWFGFWDGHGSLYGQLPFLHSYCSANGKIGLLEGVVDQVESAGAVREGRARHVDLELRLVIVAEEGRLDVLKYLKSEGAPCDQWTVYHTAKGGQLDVLEYLKSEGMSFGPRTS